MIAVEETRDVEISADVLDDDIRRVAPASDRDVAVRQREAFERCRVRAFHHLEARARGVRESARVEGVESLQVCAKLSGDLLLARGGAIGQLGSKSRSRTGVDAERRRALRLEAKKAVSKRVEQRARIGFGRRGRGRR